MELDHLLRSAVTDFFEGSGGREHLPARAPSHVSATLRPIGLVLSGPDIDFQISEVSNQLRPTKQALQRLMTRRLFAETIKRMTTASHDCGDLRGLA
jgi:hypothetical protein